MKAQVHQLSVLRHQLCLLIQRGPAQCLLDRLL
jgi:hypothetical protein